MVTRYLAFVLVIHSILLLVIAGGCVPPEQATEKKKNDGPVIGKTTTEIGEWDPNGGQKIRETDEANIVNHLRVGVEGAINGSAGIMVDRGLQLYYAEQGRYPKSYDEFMNKVFDVYIQKLPAPLTSCEYQYDVKNHRLVVVEKKKEAE